MKEPASYGFAHAKLILIGEHAVVYGHPAIVAPLPELSVTVETKRHMGGDWIASSLFEGEFSRAPDPLKGLILLINEVRRRGAAPSESLSVRIQSDIPLGYGLGSSAAVAVALTRSLCGFFGMALDQETLMGFVHIAEVYAHGRPSGIDAWGCSQDSLLWFERGQTPRSISLTEPLFLVVGQSDSPGQTRQAVSGVRTSPERDRVIGQLQQLTKESREYLQDHQYAALGRCLTKAQGLLRDVGVSTPGLDSLVEEALAQGAYGAKLTGSGGGGCMMAVARNSTHQAQIKESLQILGAPHVWTPIIDPSHGTKEHGES